MSKYKLGDIASIQAGPFGTQLHKNEYVLSGIPMLNSKNIGNGKIVTESVDFVPQTVLDRLPQYILEERYILFGRAGTIERHAYVNSKYNGSFQGTNCIRIRCHNNSYALFISYYLWLPQLKQAIENKAGGSIQSYITTDLLKDITIYLPNNYEEMAQILSIIDAKIENNNRINDNLQHQLKLMYNYWFTQFDFPDENGKPYRSSGGKMVWNEQLKRDIPQNWTVGTVSDCVEKISTGLNPRDNFVLGNGRIRYITVKNLTTTGSLDFSGCDMIDEEAKAIVHRRSDICAGDILFASIAPLGRCFLIQQEPTDWDINESVFSIRSKTDVIMPEYLYLFFQSDSFIQKATNTSTGSIFKGIRINTLLDTVMIIPELQVCKRFTGTAKPLLSEINNNSSETARLTALRNWLLPMLMNGQATISD